MRVGIVSASVPLREDAEAALGSRLEAALRDAGHAVELVLLPYSEDVDAQLAQRVAYRSMEFAAHYDLLVTLRSPAEVVRHPCKVAWLASALPEAGEGMSLAERAVAKACLRASLVGLREARRVLATDATVTGRLRHLGLDAAVVSPGDLGVLAAAVVA